MTGIDYTLPVSAVLRRATKDAHDGVQLSSTTETLVRGELTLRQYVRYLMMLYLLYDTLERGLDRHSSNPILEPTFNSALLFRAPALESDIAFLIDAPISSWKEHHLFKAITASPPVGLAKYLDRLQTLADAEDPSPLLAHAYVRYMGDLSGGQTIKHTLGKAYDLDPLGDQGLAFYTFRELHTSKPASQGEMKRIKEWFRAGMDAGVGEDVDRKIALAEEADYAFKLTHGLFDAVVDEPTVAPLVSKTTSGGYSTAKVATFILAVGLAHFMLVVFGFTGKRGYAKLAELQEFFRTVGAYFVGAK